ncbi:MAG: SPOR domain-containing protein [Idiomarina sp.]|nr:SPOR domain-containing protein [Idiomarina sp.]
MRGGEAPPPVIPVAPAEDPLPEMPEERWRYIQELENKQVEVVVPERAEAHPRLMQCGSFRREAEADALRAQIAFIGLESQIRRTEGTQGMWYRVVLGPFENQRAAQRTNNQLQRAGVHGCQIWNWTDE